MYLDHYNLKDKPFNISPDSKFLWLSEKHKEGLASLKYGVMENKGFLVLTGDIGTGKTLLINSLIKITEVQTLIATIPDPDLEIMDFFNLLSEEFNMNKVFISKGDFLIEFKQFLIESYASDKSVLLIIDEAQRLNHELLEQIRMLSNIELDNRKLINIFFVGQSEFNQLIGEDRNRAVRQRVSVNYQLEPLSKSETSEYIEHRLKIAGATEEIFKPDAVRQVFKFSKGYPRLINVICDLAMVTGYSEGIKKIEAGLIKNCEKELKIPISPDKPQNKNSVLGQVQTDGHPAVPQARQHNNLVFGFGFISVLLMAFIGFQIYGSLTESSARFKPYDYEPKTNYRLLEEQKEAFKTEIENGNLIKEGGAAGKDDTQIQGEIDSSATASLAKTQNEKERGNKEGSSKSDLMDTQPAGFIPDQRSIIYFEHNSNELTQQAYETLNSIIKFTSNRPDLKITVEGFTDSHGNPTYNKQLSKFRADMVKSYLIGQGVSASRINSFGRGPQNPLKSNSSFEGRKQNRRVEIEINSE